MKKVFIMVVGVFAALASAQNPATVDSIANVAEAAATPAVSDSAVTASAVTEAAPAVTEVAPTVSDSADPVVQTVVSDSAVPVAQTPVADSTAPVAEAAAPATPATETANIQAASDSIVASPTPAQDSASVAASNVVPQSSGIASWSWRAWVRVASVVATATLVGAGIFENYKAQEDADQFNDLPNAKKTYSRYKMAQDQIDERQLNRNIFYGIAAGTAAIGLLTFVF
ncbi:MAG: hypothetical protein HUK21_09140 [Fibrobacteraceae bacterium]|nr:hypothetical protein [Fibrobacteraceae bacterium]